MLNLILSIVFTSWLLISFRVFKLFDINQLQAIIINYLVCALIGLFFTEPIAYLSKQQSIDTWVFLAILTGACFLPTFYLMSVTVNRVSITISTIASKISLIIPVSVSILYLNKDQSFTLLNSIGLLIGLGAILLSSIKTNTTTTLVQSRFDYFLPVLVFLGGGLVDVLINITNYRFLPPELNDLFPFFAFSAAASIGFIVLLIRLFFFSEKLAFKNLWGGIILGIPNYLSIYFLLKALQDFNNNGAIIFPVLNISVILLSAFIALVFFKEKLNRYNIIGLVLAILSLVLISSTQILS